MAGEPALWPALQLGQLMAADRLTKIAAWAFEQTGHTFNDVERLNRALTHSSARSQSKANYERLEFLGDRVLGLVVAELLFADYPEADEGELSLRFNQLVDAKTCSEIATAIGLPVLIRAGSDLGNPGDTRHVNVRADVVEALIASLYQDGGLDVARAFIKRNWASRVSGPNTPRRDPKTEMQEWAHRDGATAPVYTIISREGPDHEPHFVVSIASGAYPDETGEGRSKRLAEQDAATRFLVKRGVWADEGH
jgi:ribonuclease III